MRVWINSSLDYRMTDIPWRRVNIARFQIDKGARTSTQRLEAPHAFPRRRHRASYSAAL